MTAGALIWVLVAEAVGLQATFLIAAFVVLAGVIAGVVWRVPETGHLDPQPVVYWPAARLSFDQRRRPGTKAASPRPIEQSRRPDWPFLIRRREQTTCSRPTG
jgi:hypothetical protein